VTTRRANASKRRARLSAAIDALAAAVPGGALMAATDPADFLLAVRCHIAAAEERAARAGETESRLRDEIRDLRLQVQELTEDLEDARRHGCECGEEEACRYVRERDKARAEAARYREALERIGRMTQPWNAPEIARAALARQDKP
jgi:chromosome segregation ATPase